MWPAMWPVGPGLCVHGVLATIGHWVCCLWDRCRCGDEPLCPLPCALYPVPSTLCPLPCALYPEARSCRPPVSKLHSLKPLMATPAVLMLAMPLAADGQLLAGPTVTDAACHMLRQLALLANSETSSIQAVNFDHVRTLMQLWQGAVPLRGGWAGATCRHHAGSLAAVL
jgi:hypothetical protein